MSEKIFEGKDKLNMDLIKPMEPIEVYEIVEIDKKSFMAKVKTSKGVESTKPIIDLIKECLDKPEWKEFPKFEDFAGKKPVMPDDLKNLKTGDADYDKKKKILDLIEEYQGKGGKIGLKQEYEKNLKENEKNCKTDLCNRNKNLNLLFVNFIDGFLKDKKDGNSPDDWVYVSKLFYGDDFNKDLKLCGSANINDLDSLRSFLEGDSAYGTLLDGGATGLGARKNRSFAISSPVLDQTGFHNDVFKKLVDAGKDKAIENMKAEELPNEFKEINDVKFEAADGKFIIDNLKLASGFNKENLDCDYKCKDISNTRELLNYIFDMAKKGKKTKNYNAAAILVFFAVVVCSKTEEIINENFKKQKKIYKDVYKSVKSGTPNFSMYENLRYETDVEGKKKTGTFDFRNKLGRDIKKILNIDGIGGDGKDGMIKGLYSKLEEILNKKLDGINIDDYDRYEETGDREVELNDLEIYFGDVDHFESHKGEYDDGNGNGKKSQPKPMDEGFFDDKYINLNGVIKSLFGPKANKEKVSGFNKLKGETRFSEKEVLDSYLNEAGSLPDEQNFIKVYKALKSGCEKLEILKMDGSIDEGKVKELGESFGDVIADIKRNGKIKDSDGKFGIYTTLLYLGVRCPGFWNKFKTAIFSRAASWYFEKNIKPKNFNKGESENDKKKLLPNGMLKIGASAPKKFGSNGFDEGDLGADLLKLEDIFKGTENPSVNAFSYKGKEDKTKKTTFIKGTSPLEYYLSTFKLDNFKGLDNAGKECLYSQLSNLSKENKVNELEKEKLDTVLSQMKAIVEENIFNSFVEGIDNGSLCESSVATALDTGDFSDEQKKDAAKKLANAITDDKYKNLVDAMDVTIEALEENAKFWSGLSEKNELFIFDEDQKKTLDGFIESMGKKHYNMSIQKAFDEEKGKYKSWGIPKDPETKGINVSGDAAAQSTINSLSTENTQLKNEKAELEKNLKKTNEDFDTYKASHPDSGGTGGGSGSGNPPDPNEIKKLQDEIDKLKTENNNLKSAAPENLKKLSEENTNKQKKINELEGGINNLNKGIKEKEEEIEKLKKDLTEAALKTADENTKILIDNQKAEINDLKKSKTDLIKNIDELNKEIEEKKEKIGNLEKNLTDAASKNADENAKNLIESQKNTIAELNEKITNMESAQKNIEDEKDKLEKQNKKLQDAAKKDASEQAKTVIENLEKQVADQKNKNEELEKAIADAKKNGGIKIVEIELDADQEKIVKEAVKSKDPKKLEAFLKGIRGGSELLAGAGGVTLLLLFNPVSGVVFSVLCAGGGVLVVLGIADLIRIFSILGREKDSLAKDKILGYANEKGVFNFKKVPKTVDSEKVDSEKKKNDKQKN